MDGHTIIVVGTSAGGIETITDLLHGLPRDLPASIFVVIHLRPGTPNVLAKIPQAQQTETLEYTMWAALRAPEESIELSHQVAARAREHNGEMVAQRFEEKARQAEANARSLRDLLVKDKAPA